MTFFAKIQRYVKSWTLRVLFVLNSFFFIVVLEGYHYFWKMSDSAEWCGAMYKCSEVASTNLAIFNVIAVIFNLVFYLIFNKLENKYIKPSLKEPNLIEKIFFYVGGLITVFNIVHFPLFFVFMTLSAIVFTFVKV